MFRLSTSAIINRNGFIKIVKRAEACPNKRWFKMFIIIKIVVTNYTILC